VFRRLFFGLGILLGLVSPEVAPLLSSRIWRDADTVRLNLELAGAFPASALELAAEGTEVAWRLLAEIEDGEGSRSLELRRSLRREGLDGPWLVRLEPEAELKRVRELEAALVLASRAWGVDLGTVPGPGRGLKLRLSCFPGILDSGGAWHEAGILWGFAEPRAEFSFGSATGIPY
jgi:hypothetical protein